MLKALIKKQLLETINLFTGGKKRQKSNKRGGATSGITIAIVMILLFATLCVVFGFQAYTMLPLVEAGLGWMYYAIMGMLAAVLGIFGSVFSTYQSVYRAKDNDLLLSLPIKVRYILAVRVFGVWMGSLIFEGIVMLPTLLMHWIYAPITPLTVPGGILLFVLISVFVLVLSCILGYVVALISGKLKNKSFVSVIISLVFVGIYYFAYFKLNDMITGIVANGEAFGEKIKGAAYPLYILGRTGEGHLLSALISTLAVGGAFALVYYILSKTFIRIATDNKGSRKVRYQEKTVSARSLSTALLFKESKRLTSSANYMLNCCLATLFLPVAGIFIIIKRNDIRELLGILFKDNLNGGIGLIACAAICCMSAMNIISAPSISLEGKNLWLIQSLPVPLYEVLKAKLKLHILVTEIPVLFCSICTIIALQPDVLTSVMIVLTTAVYVELFAAIGLSLNLKMPNLHWTNEAAPMKRSASVTITMLSSWALILALGLLYYVTKDILNPTLYLVICTAVLAVLTEILLNWIKKRGSVILGSL